ncbi:hypothetical protein MKX03_024774 [Papaver bracteatum]|nr:hypothetical protein MKX03_024774 [Papaver bracteatum]
MAAIYSIPIPPHLPKPLLNSKQNPKLSIALSTSIPFSPPTISSSFTRPPRIQVAAESSASTTTTTSTVEEEEDEKLDDTAISIDILKRFIDINLGKWNGFFYQFDSHGKLLQEVTTKLSSSSYGDGELISLIQTLYIKQPLLYEDEEEWAEYKIKETNMFTIDKYQQIGFFPKERAFSLRYQTAGMLEHVLRQGVLGENDTGEESPKNLKLPSRQPSVVCENCLYSQTKDLRARAFHIMDPKGILEMLLVFVEGRDGSPLPPSLASSEDSASRITSFLGRWEGHSITNRSGVYDATIAEADTVALLEFDDKGQLIQDITSTSDGGDVTTNVHWTGTVSDNLITFDGGFQTTLLPGGMYMACPCNIANSIAELKSFHLEFCWLESPTKRQRLIRTYDVEGLAVSSTYIYETKI